MSHTHMTYLEELWASVEEPDLTFLRRMQAAVPSALLNPAVLSPSGEVIPCDMTTLFIWQWKFPDAIRVDKTLVSKVEVSTVFLPVAADEDRHFETMLLSGPRSGCWQYKTLEEARAGHKMICEAIREDRLEDL